MYVFAPFPILYEILFLNGNKLSMNVLFYKNMVYFLIFSLEVKIAHISRNDSY